VSAAYLAIDFGTTQTTAAAWVEGDAPTLVKLDGRRAPMPSAVFLDGRELLVGSAALRALRAKPLHGERTPKRKLREASSFLQLGSQQLAMTDVVGRVLAHAYERCAEVMGCEPDMACLTRPVAWPEHGERETSLRGSAALAQIRCPIETISEAEAAARHLGMTLKPGESCLVYDLGGGTCDIAVMEMTKDDLQVRAESEQEIGGETFDERMLKDAIARVARENREAARWLEDITEDPFGVATDDPVALQWRTCAALLGENLRRVRVRLSKSREAALAVPEPVGMEWTVTREELERLVLEDLEETVEATLGCIDQSGQRPSVLYLAGAASAMPAVGQVLSRTVGLPPKRLEDPKSATVLGGLRKIAEPLIEAEANAKEKARRKAEAARRKREQRRHLAREVAAEQEMAEARSRIRAMTFGKIGSRDALAANLQLGESRRAVGGCRPPGSSFFHNGMLMVTDRRLVWVRESRGSTPEMRSLVWANIAQVKFVVSLKGLEVFERGGARHRFFGVPDDVLDAIRDAIV